MLFDAGDASQGGDALGGCEVICDEGSMAETRADATNATSV